MKIYSKVSLLSLSFLLVISCAAEVMVQSASQFPLELSYQISPKSSTQKVVINPGKNKIDASCIIIQKISLSGHPTYAIEAGASSCLTAFTISQEIDSVLVKKIYNVVDGQALEFVLTNGFNPLADLSSVSDLSIVDGTLQSAAITAPTFRLRGGVSGTGLQRYKKLLYAAVFDGKTSFVRAMLPYAQGMSTQDRDALKQIAQSRNFDAIAALL